MSPIHHETFRDHVAFLIGQANPDEVDQDVKAVLSALGGVLVDDEAAALGAELPAPYREALLTGRWQPELGAEGFFALVARYAHVEHGRGVELAQIVCGALGSAMSPALHERLHKHLGATLGALLDPPEPPTRPEQRPHLPPGSSTPPRTLARGNPSSLHPVSEARPELAHAHSIARSDDPHGDTKLSGARGLTQGRDHEDLAGGRPRGG